MYEEDIKWTREAFEEFNKRLEAVGLPKFIIEGNYVYKDEVHKYLGIGIQLEEG